MRDCLPARSSSLRMALISLDTRGGIQPYVALARGLQAAGHTVRLLAPADFTPFLRTWGVPAAPLERLVAALRQATTDAGMRAVSLLQQAADESRLARAS